MPLEYSYAFFNQRWVQEALGVPLNFTISNGAIVESFFEGTGDPLRASISALEQVLDAGIAVAMVYGDRDYRCNWIGAENVSLVMSYPEANQFRAAGYEPITTSATYTGGLVRQHGNISFSRVFEAGHSVAAYQPETFFHIFQRAMFGKDIATGDISIDNGSVTGYSSKGKASSFSVKNVAPPNPEPLCYLYDVPNTCQPNQVLALAEGEAIVEDFVVTNPGPVAPNALSGTRSGNSTSVITPVPSASSPAANMKSTVRSTQSATSDSSTTPVSTKDRLPLTLLMLVLAGAFSLI